MIVQASMPWQQGDEMDWQDILNDPSLRDLPYKIETNEYGTIMMSPASNRHSRLQSRIDRLLGRVLGGGEPLTESPIDTSRGVKVADVVWCSATFLARHGDTTPFPEAPELCVEIASPSNRTGELEKKWELYLEAGALEVWLVGESGEVEIFGPEGAREASRLGVFDFTELRL